MRRLLLVLTLLACAPLVRGEERFHIARIDVRSLVHASADVIRSESRLRAGESYAESELRAANDRIRRLPFLLDATFSLERGNVRDEYVLVITVTETRPLFYRFELVPFVQSRDNLALVDSVSLLGARWFAGRRDVFHIATLSHDSDRPFESDYLAFQAGYTRYGDRAFLTLTANRIAPRGSGEHGATVPGAVAGISLTPNQTLTISYSEIRFGKDNGRAERILEPRLAYNTTNHPYFPTSGTLVSVAPVFAWIDGVGFGGIAFHDADIALDGHAARYWPLSEGLTAGVIADGGFLHVGERSAQFDRAFGIKYGSATVTLWKALGDPSRESDRRIELQLRAVTRHREVVPTRPDNKGGQVSMAWVRRNGWGVLRFGMGYSW